MFSLNNQKSTINVVTKKTNKNDNEDPKFIRYAFKWFKVFTALCICNSVILVTFVNDHYIYAFALPGFHFLTFLVIGSIYTASFYPDSRYIQSNYPEIWDKIYPTVRHPFSWIYRVGFRDGVYDDNSDIELNKIKKRWHNNDSLIKKPLFLIIKIWGINIVVLIVHSIFSYMYQYNN